MKMLRAGKPAGETDSQGGASPSGTMGRCARPVAKQVLTLSGLLAFTTGFRQLLIFALALSHAAAPKP